MSLQEGPFPMAPEDIDYYWSKFPEMDREEFVNFLRIYKDSSDIQNVYKNENNEAQ